MEHQTSIAEGGQPCDGRLTIEPFLTRLGRQIDLAQRRLRFRLADSRFNPRRIPTLDPQRFAGLRVIIIGPAATVVEDLAGIDVDGFDVIVRLNNGIPPALAAPAVLGARTDILFHNLNETGPRPAGAIPPELLRRAGVKICVFPHWGFQGNKRALERKRRELSGVSEVSLQVPPARFYEGLRRDLDGLKPTIGLVAIAYFLACPLRELQIHGFTFFQTRYLPGYNDQVTTDEDARRWVGSSERHDPARERLLVQQTLQRARDRDLTVTLGRHVETHLWVS
ncbi:hypothetical protein ACLE20_08030 [Rhizobium sp. YIM 134829]|uniref:hypothetical protein n=1 Tax=Rhizobium sp. YIM 134829 TaxID=3390453 RepID=UPI003979165D